MVALLLARGAAVEGGYDGQKGKPPFPPLHWAVRERHLAVARLLSHRMVVMKDGRIVEHGLTDRLLDDPQAPYTQLLVSSILQV